MNNQLLLTYNIQIFNQLYGKYSSFQLGFFNGSSILFLGQNPGRPFNKKLQTELEILVQKNTFLSFQQLYEQSIRDTLMGQFITKIIGNDWSKISLTNVVKIATTFNELPSTKLINEFLPITKKQIELLQPNIILCLGKFVGSFFELYSFYDCKKINNNYYMLVPHPSYLFRKDLINETVPKIKNLLTNFQTICQKSFLKQTQLTLFT